MSVWTVPNYSDDWAVPGYTEERQLGRGASGRVVAAVSTETGQRVAIKYLGAALVRDPAFMWGFRTEAELMRAFDVPQVVHIYDYVEHPGQGAAIVMELIDGVSLHEMIAHNGPTSPEAALAVLKGSLLGLAAAHAIGIVHRDYKPENVLVDTNGNSKLSDFGVAIKAGKQVPMAGTPLYMAPEQWQGAPSSPATDIYAATAVFYECLTGQTPFSGKLGQLRDQHLAAPVPIDQVDASLHELIARGMAKNPAARPQTAISFVAELESAAAAAYGPGWEERGRGQLAERAIALLPLLIRDSKPGSRAGSAASTWLNGGNGRRGKVVGVVAIAAAAVISLAAAATAVTLSGNSGDQASLNSQSEAATTLATFTAQAAVSPPVRVSDCSAPSAFTYTGTLTASSAGTVSYQWVYSSGQNGPVETVRFAAAGHQQVTGATVTGESASSGWGEIKVTSPAPQASNKASYQLLCSSTAGGIIPSATVSPTAKTVACGTTPPPSFSASGSITADKAETVTYHWALSDGQDSPAQALTFGGPSTQAVAPLTITPPGDTTSGEAVLVVTSPVAAASSPAAYSLSCTGVTSQKATAVAAVSPATASVGTCTGTAPAFSFTGSITAAMAGTVSYYWKLPNGDGPAQTLQFATAGTKAVTAASYTPSADTATGSGSIVVTSAGGGASNAAAFTLTCGTGLSIATSGAATATTGAAYSATATATGGSGSFKWAAVTGLPAGLTATANANAGTLTISGTPTATGTFSAKLSVSDTSSPVKTATATLALTVSAPALSVTTSSLAAGTSGTAYSATVTATGGSGTDTWTATGLPTGLTMGTAGTISGTPTETGTYSVTVTVTDTASPAQTAMATLSLAVSAPALSITTASLGNGIAGTAYTATVAATGGAGTDTWSATGLPAGLAMSAAGTISGTPTASGTFSVAVTVTDTASPVQTASATFSVTINAAAVVTPSSSASSSAKASTSTSAKASTSTSAKASASAPISVSVSPSATPSPSAIID